MRKARKDGEAPLVSEPTPDFFSALSFFWRGIPAVFFFASCILNVALWVALFVRIGIGAGTVVLRYNVYFGIDLTGSPRQAFLIPIMVTIFFVMNMLLAFLFVRRGTPFLGLFLTVSSFFIHVAASIAVLALIRVN